RRSCSHRHERKTQIMSVSPDRRLTEGEQLVLAAMQSADDAIVTMALDGTITHWNRAAEQLFGYSAREAIGTNIGIIVPGDRKGEMLGELARIARGERVHHYETVRVAKDGRSIGVSLSVFPVRSPSGAIVGASKIARDITERKSAEKTLSWGNYNGLYCFGVFFPPLPYVFLRIGMCC